MKKLPYVPLASGRPFGSWVCLAATMLLFAPMWAAAWQAHAMACCTGEICPAHGHPGTKGTAKTQAATPDDASMACPHENQPDIVACQMSCCNQQDTPAT